MSFSFNCQLGIWLNVEADVWSWFFPDVPLTELLGEGFFDIVSQFGDSTFEASSFA